ncbi:hypothetical protein DYB32_001904, partial [Aphanomyces invadans]
SAKRHTTMSRKFKWKVDAEKHVVVWNFERRGWQKTEGNDWNIYWANKQSIKSMFNPENGVRLTDGQYVNHFPNHYELTRKDLMVKNIKRSVYDRPSPRSPLFMRSWQEFRRNPNVMWIMKPCSKAQGKGIFIINKLSQTKKWANAKAVEGYVVSRYIENPLLIGGKKFDLRIHVWGLLCLDCRLRLGGRCLNVAYYRWFVVLFVCCIDLTVSTHACDIVQAFVYSEGFARFCNVKYSSDIDDMDNPFMHLTNVAVQKHNEDYNNKHGGKWNIYNLRLYVEATRGRRPQTVARRGSLNPLDVSKRALCQVNASPSLTTTTIEDRNMKSRLLRDVLELAVVNDAVDQRRSFQPPELSATNGFEWLINEASVLEAEKLHKKASRRNATEWR